MDVIRLVLRPHDKHPGGYRAILDGEPLLWSRQPLYDGARALLARGGDPETVIEARHEDSAIVALRSTVGEAAKWTVEERDRGGLRRVPWKPYLKPAQDADCSYAVAPDFARNAEKGGAVASGPANAPFEAPRAERARR